MVVGSGMIANVFKKYKKFDDIVIFASGVSNSKTPSKSDFQREESLLKKTISYNKNKLLVYFSTCGIEDVSINFYPYYSHKLDMESIIKKCCNKFHIFRLPQVAGTTKNNTFLKFMFDSILSNRKIELKRYSSRNIILIKDVYKIINYLITNQKFKNQIINIASETNTPVEKIINKIEHLLKIKANYIFINEGCDQNINISQLKSLNINLNVFKSNYLDNILIKYYNHYYKKVK